MGQIQVIPSRRLIRKEATRRDLMQAGRKLFSRKGLYESRIEDLTESAGIAKGTLYLYFRNKEELIREVTAAGYDDLREHVTRHLGRARTTSGLVRAIVKAHLEFFADHPDLVRIFHQVRGMLKFQRREWRSLSVPLEGHVRFLADVLSRATRPPGNARERRRLAIQIYGTVSGVTSVQIALDGRIDLRGMLSKGTMPQPRPRRLRRRRTGSAR
ncbi:MAG TPA: TetR/AcrR family transcriptional regulator [Candidatus Eisenbacteria bacterium]|nr:TetR/AcrR family transcriptional regulator [Candidatus Eisenbacteria bacterium]